MDYKQTTHKQQGAVSLFIVIFTALLVTIVTVGFVQIMLRTQQEASVVDLSQSAYDSALAGVEDAKRAILVAEQNNTASNALNTKECDSVSKALGTGNHKETLIQQNVGPDGDELLDQAYTCVKIERDTAYVRGENLDLKSQLIPLTSTNKFNKIRISWKLHQDSNVTTPPTTYLPPVDPAQPTKLPRKSDWRVDTPALLRAQLIQFGGSSINKYLSDFDSDDGTPSDNSRTKFLYPSQIGSNVDDFTNDSRPTPVACDDSVGTDYSCSVTITLPKPKDDDASDRQAFLRLNALYNTADYQIELLSSSNKVVNFSGVQAQVDSTGRAGDVFRRVNAMVNLKITDFPYPESAINLQASLCKTFSVTNDKKDYNPGLCKPYDKN